MKKKTTHLFFFICFVVLLTGCGAKKSSRTEKLSVEPQINALHEAENEETVDEQDKQMEEAVWNAVEESDAVVEEAQESEASPEFEQIVVETKQTRLSPADQSELEKARKKLGLTEENIPNLKAAQEKNYYPHPAFWRMQCPIP